MTTLRIGGMRISRVVFSVLLVCCVHENVAARRKIRTLLEALASISNGTHHASAFEAGHATLLASIEDGTKDSSANEAGHATLVSIQNGTHHFIANTAGHDALASFENGTHHSSANEAGHATLASIENGTHHFSANTAGHGALAPFENGMHDVSANEAGHATSSSFENGTHNFSANEAASVENSTHHFSASEAGQGTASHFEAGGSAALIESREWKLSPSVINKMTMILVAFFLLACVFCYAAESFFRREDAGRTLRLMQAQTSVDAALQNNGRRWEVDPQPFGESFAVSK